MKARCSDCDAAKRDGLVGASQTVIEFTRDGQKYWQYKVKIDMHHDGSGELCPGSGKVV